MFLLSLLLHLLEDLDGDHHRGLLDLVLPVASEVSVC